MAALEPVVRERVLDAGAVVVEPGLPRGAAAREEEDVRADALGVEDARREPQDRVQVVVREQPAADRLAGPALEEDVVRQDDGGASADLQEQHDVLEEVQLVVRGRREEVLAHLGDRAEARRADAERGIGEDDVVERLRRLLERVLALDGAGLHAGAVEVEVHRGERDDERRDVVAAEGLVLQELLLPAVGGLSLHVVEGGEEEAARAAGGVADGLGDLRVDDVHHRLDERARREILAGAGLLVLSVLLEDALVDGALGVDLEGEPVLGVDEGDDLGEVGGLGDRVLGLGEDGADEAVLARELLERLLVAGEEVEAGEVDEAGPAAVLRDLARDAQGLGLRVHLEEEDVGELDDVVGEADAGGREDVRELPHLGDECLFVFCHVRLPS